MTTSQFWHIIDSTITGIGPDRKLQVKRLQKILQQSTPPELESFHRNLHTQLAKATTLHFMFATFAVFGQLTDQLFLEFRAWVLLHGSESFAAAVKNPDTIATLLTRKQVDQTDIGEFLALAPTLWLQRTGDVDNWNKTFSVPKQRPMKGNWPKDKSDFERRYPILFKAFWNQTRVNARNAPPSNGKAPRRTRSPQKIQPIRAMSPSRFWKIIDSTKHGIGPNRQAQIDRISTLLASLTPNALASFQRQLNRQLQKAYIFDLMAAAYVIECHISDDSFEYFRAWLLLHGSRAFAAALKNPDTITKLISRSQVDDINCADFPQLTLRLWEQRGGDFDTFFEKAGHLRDPDIPMPWPESAREFKARYPVLFKAFWNPGRMKLFHPN